MRLTDWIQRVRDRQNSSFGKRTRARKRPSVEAQASPERVERLEDRTLLAGAVDGSLSIEVMAAPNFVVDSNIE